MVQDTWGDAVCLYDIVEDDGTTGPLQNCVAMQRLHRDSAVDLVHVQPVLQQVEIRHLINAGLFLEHKHVAPRSARQGVAARIAHKGIATRSPEKCIAPAAT